MADKRIPAPATGTLGSTPATSITPTADTAQPAGAFTTASALRLLWDKAGSKMSLGELQWVADGAASQVSCQTRALATTLEGLACLVANDEDVGSFQDSVSVSRLLFGLHGQLDALAGLSELAEDAHDRVRSALKGGAA